MPDNTRQIAEFLEALVAHGQMPLTSWPGEAGTHETYGLSSTAGAIFLDPNVEVLDETAVTDHLSASAASWLQRLDVHRALGSTNQYLMDRAQHGSINGWICLADAQTRGRGRRGRSWVSPFAQNLAMSLGIAIDADPSALGGLSLAVGLAAFDCLSAMEVQDVELKWPNDLLLHGEKLGGILLELVAGDAVEIVVGIGLNLELTEAVRGEVDQAAADLSSHGYRLSRNELAGRLASAIVDYATQFEREGFAPMRTVFDAHHRYHGRRCKVVSGMNEVVGVVAGVSEIGALVLETAAGRRSFISGEVSLRELT